jgi:hypothetical protein
MSKRNPVPVSKISIKVWKPIIAKLNEKLRSGCLRRDAYLARVLEVELEWLDQEVSIPNSAASYEYVVSELDRFDRKLVSLALPPELTARLNDVCTRKNIVRDAFFNRLLLLLAAEPKVIDALFFASESSDWRVDVWSELKNEGPFFQNGFYPLEPNIDPFWAIRAGLELYASKEGVEEFIEPQSQQTIKVQRSITGELLPIDSLYTRSFGERMRMGSPLGFSCYLPDSRVPGHPTAQLHAAKLDELLQSLDAEIEAIK